MVVDVQATAADNRTSDFPANCRSAPTPTLVFATSHARHMASAASAMLPDDRFVTRADASVRAWLPTVLEASKC